MFLNLMIAFLWREWRDTPATKSYFIKKMNMEFQELLLNKAAGKILQQISVKDYCLGDSLPVIQSKYLSISCPSTYLILLLLHVPSSVSRGLEDMILHLSLSLAITTASP